MPVVQTSVVAVQPTQTFVQPIMVQPIQTYAQPVQTVVQQPQPSASDNPNTVYIPNPEPVGPPGQRTLGMRLHALIELGVLLCLLVLCSVSLSAPSYSLETKSELSIADIVSKALGIPSLILVGLIMIRLAVLMVFRWTFRRGQVVKLALLAAAVLWTVCTAVHVFLVVLVQVKYGTIYIHTGIGLAISMVPLHVFSCVLGNDAVNRLL